MSTDELRASLINNFEELNSTNASELEDINEFDTEYKQKKADIELDILQENLKRVTLANTVREQIIGQRKWLFRVLIGLMIVESLFLFTLIFIGTFQIDWLPKLRENPVFLNKDVLQIIVGATLIQLATMIVFMIKSIFPGKVADITSNDSSDITGS